MKLRSGSSELRQPPRISFFIPEGCEDKNGVEHFWVGDLKLDAEPYSGKIGDEPGIVKKVKFGQNFDSGVTNPVTEVTKPVTRKKV